MFACPHCDLVSGSSRDHFKHLRRCQSNRATESTIIHKPILGGTPQIPLPQQHLLDSFVNETSNHFQESPHQQQHIADTHYPEMNPLNYENDEITDDGGELIEETMQYYNNPDPDNEPNDSGDLTHLPKFQFTSLQYRSWFFSFFKIKIWWRQIKYQRLTKYSFGSTKILWLEIKELRGVVATIQHTGAVWVPIRVDPAWR